MHIEAIMNETASPTATVNVGGIGDLKIIYPSRDEKHSAGNLNNSFNIAYSSIMQNLSKFYSYDVSTLTAATLSALTSAHLPLTLTPHNSSENPNKGGIIYSPATITKISKHNPTKILTANREKCDSTVPVTPTEDNEKALDLSVQGLKSIYSSYQRISLEQIKQKVVEDVWVENDVQLTWTESKVAAYNPAQKLFMCVDCECVGFLSRVAEHWLGAHANMRVFHCPRCPYTSAWSRCVKMHLTRQHNEQFADTTMWKENATLMEITQLMQELRNKVEVRIDASNTLADKRFYCPHCPYATDRRDLYTRHENIHKDIKPFHCYLCCKQFNRADHVKKHFVRMHPETEYDTGKIRKHSSTSRSGNRSATPPVTCELQIVPTAEPVKPSHSTEIPPVAPYPSLPVVNIVPSVVSVTQNSSAFSRGDAESPDLGRARKRGDKAYTCPYCQWSGSDNWCLKRHMNTHIKPFACIMCDYKAARAERLSTHVLKVHNKRICNKCNYLADTQEALLEHTRKEHLNNPYSRRYVCSVCGLIFDSRPALETHQHLNHSASLSRPAHSLVALSKAKPSAFFQDAAEDLSLRKPEDLFFNESGANLTTSKQISNGFHLEYDNVSKELNKETACPHCGYQLLVQDELSKDHWLTHHKDVCPACVHIFTSVYGPRLWKKIHIKNEHSESSLDAIVTDLNRKGESVKNWHGFPKWPTCPVSPESTDYENDKPEKRCRKQSCPRKVIVYAASVKKELKSQKLSKIHKRNKNFGAFGSFRCWLCRKQPIFSSRIRLQVHRRVKHKLPLQKKKRNLYLHSRLILLNSFNT